VHVVTIIADSFAHVGVTGAIIPFTAGYRATWVGLGTIAAYGVVLVAGFGAARGRLAASPTGARLWRSTHLVAYGAWALAILHGYTSGTDSNVPWVIALYLLCLVSVAGCGCARLAHLSGRPVPARDLERSRAAAMTTTPILSKAAGR